MEANRNFEMEQRLWDYIDGLSSGPEREAVQRLVATESEWKKKYEELQAIGGLLKQSELESPSLRFTRNVMEEIAKFHIAPATKTYISKKVIFSIATFFVAMIIGFLVYGLSQVSAGTIPENEISRQVSQIDFSRFFNNTYMNVLLMINLLVGLFLLDNYFSRRKRSWKNS